MTNFFDNFEVIKYKTDNVTSGRLAPDGTFEDCLYGEHSDLATQLIQENGWLNEWRTSRHNNICKYTRDFLVHTKNYILLDCPTCNDKDQHITFNPLKRHPNKQMQVLLNMFKDDKGLYSTILERITK